jgi:GAF domain-containing protein
MTTEPFLNTYHNARTAPSAEVPADLAGFMLAADPVLAEAVELARILARAHQGAATQLIGDEWAHARKYFSLSEKYAEWADYRTPAKGLGIHAYAHKVTRPIRLTDEELRAHDEWRNFGREIDNHPPMRGWLAVPLVGSDGVNYGFIQASDRLEGEFTEQDEANLVRLAALTSTALDALSQLHLHDYRREVPELSSGSTSDAPKEVSVGQEVTYVQHIRPLFRDRDIQSMSFAFDLSSYEDVRANAEAIHEKLAAGIMPCDGRWPDQQVELFRTWIDQGSKP